ncbi:MAG: heavy-metal-associated domain-containing protein [Nanoarchaeota archaeon]
MKKIKLTIEGMHCNSCAMIIEMELKDYVNKIKVNLQKNSAEIDFDEKKINQNKIIDLITKLGYVVNG